MDDIKLYVRSTGDTDSMIYNNDIKHVIQAREEWLDGNKERKGSYNLGDNTTTGPY